MLDYFAIFTRGGALLWTLQFTALRHSPLDALNALIRTCLLEERSSDNTFTYVPKTGAHQALKWTFNNVRVWEREQRMQSCTGVARWRKALHAWPQGQAERPPSHSSTCRAWVLCLWQCTKSLCRCCTWMSCWRW